MTDQIGTGQILDYVESMYFVSFAEYCRRIYFVFNEVCDDAIPTPTFQFTSAP